MTDRNDDSNEAMMIQILEFMHLIEAEPKLQLLYLMAATAALAERQHGDQGGTVLLAGLRPAFDQWEKRNAQKDLPLDDNSDLTRDLCDFAQSRTPSVSNAASAMIGGAVSMLSQRLPPEITASIARQCIGDALMLADTKGNA